MKKPSIPQASFLFISFMLSVKSYAQAPANNAFASATLITTANNCAAGLSSLTSQTLFNATADGGSIASACGAVNAPDVWYRFVAKTSFPQITISNLGTSWGTNLKIQLLSGATIPTLTEVACANNAPLVPSTPLTTGTQYYIRIYKTSVAAPGGSASLWNFDICVADAIVGSRNNEVFRETILSAPNILNYPWEITYGPDDSLWVTESRGYKAYKMHPGNGGKRTILDVSAGSTWISANTPGNPVALDSLDVQNPGVWNGSFPLGTATNPPWPQGGFAGMALHPNLLQNMGKDYVYVAYVHRYIGGGGTTNGIIFRNKLVRFTYNTATGRCGSPVVICDTLPGSSDHNSQRMIIAPVGDTTYLFYASGDMGSGQFGNRDRPNKAQNQASYEGKILRFRLDSAGFNSFIPSNNPYGPASAVWSIGIRNNQGFAYDNVSNLLYGTSHGPYSDDELNIIQGFKNYGHPLVIGYAEGNYNGTTTPGANTSITAGAPFTDNSGNSSCPKIGDEVVNMNTLNSPAVAAVKGPYVDPVFSAYAAPHGAIGTANTIADIWATNPGNAFWPSEGWSGLDLYSNTAIPGWKNSLIAAGLKWGRLIKLKLGAGGTTIDSSGSGVRHDTLTYFQSTNRYRDIAFGPDGKDIYIVMDNTSATSGPGVGNPVVPACRGCVIKYSFLGYLDNGGKSSIDTSVKVATGTVNTIINGTTITIDNSNKDSLWVPITGPDGRILAEIYPNGNALGTVTSAFYISSVVRQAGGIKYLNRNITITPQNQPASQVKVRLYISKTELDALIASPGSGISGIGNLKILKNNDPAGSAIVSSAPPRTPVFAGLFDANGYYLQDTISSFSSFYFAASLITLPADVLTFSGTLQANGSALVKWKTANEINTAAYTVERSINGIDFTAIGTVPARGANGTAAIYEFTDNRASSLAVPVVYYRLLIKDVNGNTKHSAIVAIPITAITGSISITPNPAAAQAAIKITSPADGIIEYKLTETSGRTLLRGTAYVRKENPAVITIDISHLPCAVYFLNITGAGMNIHSKLLKQ